MKAGKYLLMETMFVAVKPLQSLWCLFLICDVNPGPAEPAYLPLQNV